jgi:hypothetical protein
VKRQECLSILGTAEAIMLVGDPPILYVARFPRRKEKWKLFM